MKNIIVILVVFVTVTLGYSQSIERKVLDSLLNQQITNNTKVVGIGDIATYPSRKTSYYALEISKYLVNNKMFRNILVEVTDMALRPINDYINDETPYSDKKAEALIKTASTQMGGYSILDTPAFSELVHFLKEYNLHSKAKVNLYGAVYMSPMPLYFLQNYVTALDKSNDKTEVKKWATLNMQDAVTVCEEIVKWYTIHLEEIEKLPKNQYYRNLIKDVNSAQLLLTIVKNKYNEDKIRTLISEDLSEQIVNLEGKSIVWGRNRIVVKSFEIDKEPSSFFVGSFLNTSLKDDYYSIIFDFSKKARVKLHKKGSDNFIEQEFIAEKGATARSFGQKTSKRFYLSEELKGMKNPLRIISLPYNFGEYKNYININNTDFNLLIIEEEL